MMEDFFFVDGERPSQHMGQSPMVSLDSPWYQFSIPNMMQLAVGDTRVTIAGLNNWYAV